MHLQISLICFNLTELNSRHFASLKGLILNNRLLQFLGVILTPMVLMGPLLADEAPPLERPAWRLQQGHPLHLQLEQWALASGWQLVWHPEFSWLIAADAQFYGEFPEAVSQVVESLFAEGHSIRLVLWKGNAVAEVFTDERR